MLFKNILIFVCFLINVVVSIKYTNSELLEKITNIIDNNTNNKNINKCINKYYYKKNYKRNIKNYKEKNKNLKKIQN